MFALPGNTAPLTASWSYPVPGALPGPLIWNPNEAANPSVIEPIVRRPIGKGSPGRMEPKLGPGVVTDPVVPVPCRRPAPLRVTGLDAIDPGAMTDRVPVSTIVPPTNALTPTSVSVPGPATRSVPPPVT